MPSKNYNGNNPLGRKRIKSNGQDASGAFARVETEIGRLQPALSLQTGSLQLPNGRVQVSRRARRGGGGTAAGCIPWKPTVVNTSETEVPDYKIRLSPGTINGVINPAWNDLVNIPDIATLYYIIATVNFTDGVVTSISYSLSASIPQGAELDPMTLSSIPTSVKVILGTTQNSTSCMVRKTNLSLEPYAAFQADISAPGLGLLPYEVYYKLRITEA